MATYAKITACPRGLWKRSAWALVRIEPGPTPDAASTVSSYKASRIRMGGVPEDSFEFATVLAGDVLLNLPFQTSSGVMPLENGCFEEGPFLTFTKEGWDSLRIEPVSHAELPAYLGAPVVIEELHSIIRDGGGRGTP